MPAIAQSRSCRRRCTDHGRISQAQWRLSHCRVRTSTEGKMADDSFTASPSAPLACGYDDSTSFRLFRLCSSPVEAILTGASLEWRTLCSKLRAAEDGRMRFARQSTRIGRMVFSLASQRVGCEVVACFLRRDILVASCLVQVKF